MASLDKIEALVGAFEDNVAQEIFLATQGMVEELAELLTKQQPIVQMVVELLGPPSAAESPEIVQFRQRLSLAVERREAAVAALAERVGPLKDEMVRLRQANKLLQDWKRVWLAPEQESSARLPTSYA